MGDSHNDALRVDFDRQIKLEFHGSTVTSDAGLLAYRELDNALGLTSTAATGLHDTRTGDTREVADYPSEHCHVEEIFTAPASEQTRGREFGST
jgi:hypothetical protein